MELRRAALVVQADRGLLRVGPEPIQMAASAGVLAAVLVTVWAMVVRVP